MLRKKSVSAPSVVVAEVEDDFGLPSSLILVSLSFRIKSALRASHFSLVASKNGSSFSFSELFCGGGWMGAFLSSDYVWVVVVDIEVLPRRR